MTKSERVILLGSGGHARVLLESLTLAGATVAGFVAPSAEESRLGDLDYLGNDEQLLAQGPAGVTLVNGIGSVRAPRLRQLVFEQYTAAGFEFGQVLDPRANISPSATLGAGIQVLVGAIVGAGVHIRENAIINSGAIVDHDSIIGAHSHVSPGAVLAGDVTVGEGSHIGLGARVIQGISVGAEATVGAGAVVIADVAAATTVVGVPAR